MMLSRKRIDLSFSSGHYDRPPVYYMGTPQINARLIRRLGLDQHADENEIGTALGTDIVFAKPRFAGPAGAPAGFPISEVHAQIHGEGATVATGTTPSPDVGGGGTRGALREIENPADVDSVACWPDPEHFDYEQPPAIKAAHAEKAVLARGNGALFLAAMSLRGMAEFLMDMALNPTMCHAILDRVANYYAARLDKLLSTSGDYIDVVDIGDDVAGQNGMLFSIAMWREFIKPYLARLVRTARRYTKRTLFFGCGGFRPIIDDLIEIGFDAVGRLQSEARGNDFSELHRDFGKRVSLWGAIDAQHILVNGSPREVADHVASICNTAMPTGRVVLGPTHTFTADTPVDNIIAMYRALGALPPESIT